jgi:hypothetical protein
MLQIWRNNAKTTYHISIIRITHANPNSVLTNIINHFKGYFGTSNQYELKFDKQWGTNSILTSSSRKSDALDLDKIRSDIMNYVVQQYGNIVDTSRYPTGLPPQHVDVGGDMTLIGQKWDVSYSIL